MPRRLGAMLWLTSALCLLLLHSSAQAGTGPRYRTAYACEGSNLSFSCEQGEVIRLVRANFGRFSITICNEHGNTDWSVNCMSRKSISVLTDRCGEKQSCSVPASEAEFGDPCPSTHKYLEAHYMCVPAAVQPTTKKAIPSWLPQTTTQPPPPPILTETPFKPPPPPIPTTSTTTTTTTTTASTTTATTTTTTTTAPISVVPPNPHRDQELVETHDDIDVDGRHEEITGVRTEPRHHPDSGERRPYHETPVHRGYYSSSVPPRPSPERTPERPAVPVPADPADTACQAQQNRDIFWNWTNVGEDEEHPCPHGAQGVARWGCRQTADGPRRTPEHPDLSSCRSRWLSSLEERFEEKVSVLQVASELADVTDAQPMLGGDLEATVRLINGLPLKLNSGSTTLEPQQREADVAALTKTIVRTTSNLLAPEQSEMWDDLGEERQRPVMTSLMLGLEENAFLLANNLAEEKSVVQYSENVLLSARLMTVWNQEAVEFPSEEEREQLTQVKDYVRIPGESLQANSDGGRTVVVFMSYEGMNNILKPSQEEQQQPAPGEPLIRPIINSRVVSASLGKGRHVELPYPALLVFRHLNTENVSNPRCVYWDYTLDNWSKKGCRRLATNASHTTCECDHLTNFAVLMDIHTTPLSETHRISLEIITYIGCGVSIVCLLLAIITFQFFRGLKSDRNSIHKNLCICLLIGEVVFLAGIGQTHLRIVCGVVAGLLHYFFLAAFAWMFFEGFQLYVMLIEVFEAEKSRIRWYYLAAYGLPAIVVGVSCIVDATSYGTPDYCWLATDNYFILAFVGPVVLVVLANLVFLAMAVAMMCRHSVATVTMKSKEQSRLSSASDEEESVLTLKMKAHIAWIRGAVALVFLLGLTWSVGLLYINERSVGAAYAFTILNSLQGLFIFFFHCVQNEKTRSEYRRFFSSCTWLPACLRPAKTKESSSFYSSNTHSNTQTTHAAGSPTTYLANMWNQPEEDPTKGRAATTTETRIGHGSLRTPTHRSLTRDKQSASLRSAGHDSGNGGSAPDSPPRINNYPLQQLNGSLVPNPDFFAAAYSQQRWRPAGAAAGHPYVEVGEPVYEEIDREPHADLSDEELRRQSDISRQSSRSYGDSRPLIPYYPDQQLAEEPGRRLAAQVAQASAPPPPDTHTLEALAARRAPISSLCETNLRHFNQRQVMSDLQQLQHLQQLQATERHVAGLPCAAPLGAERPPALRTEPAGRSAVTAHNV